MRRCAAFRRVLKEDWHSGRAITSQGHQSGVCAMGAQPQASARDTTWGGGKNTDCGSCFFECSQILFLQNFVDTY